MKSITSVVIGRSGMVFATLAMATLLAGCVVAPAPRAYGPVAPAPVAVAPPPPNPMVYPAKGQSNEQMAQDRQACNQWAVQQSGFDPYNPANAPRTAVVTPAHAPGSGTAVGAIAGAVLGAVLSGPRDSGFGAVFGGLTGASIGSSVDANAQWQANAEQSQINRSEYQRVAAGNNAYTRALGACLEARGYTVR